jgi:hypothetical protein
MVFALFLVGAAAAYAFLAFDARYACDRATDSCELVEAKIFSRTVVERFRPSQVVKASYFQGRRACAVVQLAGGAPDVRICRKVGEEYVALLNDFIANPGIARLDYRVDVDFSDFMFPAMVGFFSLIPLFGAVYLTGRKLRGQ